MSTHNPESELWQQFLVKLRMAGTTIEDIQECSPTVLHTLLVELGFSALQSARLETEWSRRRPPSLSPARIPLAETSQEFKEIANAAMGYFHTVRQQGGAVNILAVERISNPMQEASFRTRKADLCNSGSVPLRKWYPLPFELVDRVVAEGFQTLENSVATQTPFGRGFMVSSEADVQNYGVSIQGNKLVLVDVCIGNTKLILESECGELYRGRPSSEMMRLLFEEGCDSVQGRRRSNNNDVFVVYHPNQLLSKYIVTYSVNVAAPLVGSAGGMHALRCR
eukprot:PhF_6_TR24806/c0_g1_i1/m.34138